jgi:hypothetical protein
VYSESAKDIKVVDAFDGALSPFPDKGKVFIGFVTHQTTGMNYSES